jgi:hypothetical protein
LGHIDVSDASLYLNTDKANSLSLAYFTVGVTSREYAASPPFVNSDAIGILLSLATLV